MALGRELPSNSPERDEEEDLPLYTRTLSWVPSVRNLKNINLMFVFEDKVHEQSMLLEYSPFLFENIMPLVPDRVTTRCEHELVAVTYSPVEE